MAWYRLSATFCQQVRRSPEVAGKKRKDNNRENNGPNKKPMRQMSLCEFGKEKYVSCEERKAV